VETLVDELCIKLKELEGGSSHDEKEESKKSSDEPKTNLEALTPRDRALRYYAAFPSLESVSIKKFSFKNFANSNNNKDNGINLHNNKNNSAYNKKTKMSIVSITLLYLFGILYNYQYGKLLFSFFPFLEY